MSLDEASEMILQDIDKEHDVIEETEYKDHTNKLTDHKNACKANSSFKYMHHWITHVSSVVLGSAACSGNVWNSLITLVERDTWSVVFGFVCLLASIVTNCMYMNSGPTRWQKIPKTVIVLFGSLCMLMMIGVNEESIAWGVLGALSPAGMWGVDAWMRPDVFALMSVKGSTCQLENNLLTTAWDLAKLDPTSCFAKGAEHVMERFPNLPHFELPELVDLSTYIAFMHVSLFIQRSLAYAHVGWIVGWFVGLSVKGNDTDEQTNFQKIELLCASAVFSSKAVIFWFDSTWCLLYPENNRRLGLGQTYAVFFIQPRVFVGDPFFVCLFMIFIFLCLKLFNRV